MDLETRQHIRQMYRDWMPKLEKDYSRHDPYAGGWINLIRFTPIEKNVWADIRFIGLPFLPQFPVGPFFIDFADPFKKIGIEVDGKQWHENKAKDDLRQRWLEERGWEIYRILGRQTYGSPEDDDEDYDMCDDEENEEDESVDLESSEGILRKIKKDRYE
mgnify:CR=1 FL=1